MFRIEEQTLPPRARRVTATDVSDEVLSGTWVVDVRSQRPRDTDPAAYVGWLRAAEDGFAFLADTAQELEERVDLIA